MVLMTASPSGWRNIPPLCAPALFAIAAAELGLRLAAGMEPGMERVEAEATVRDPLGKQNAILADSCSFIPDVPLPAQLGSAIHLTCTAVLQLASTF